MATEIENNFQIHLSLRGLRAAINRLTQTGLIQYDSINDRTNKRSVVYTINNPTGMEVPIVSEFVSLNKEIVLICRELNKEGNEITQAAVFSKISSDTRKRNKDYTLNTHIPGILSRLSKQGFLQRGELGGRNRSRGSITTAGRLIVEELLLPIKDIVEGDSILYHWKKEVLPKVMSNLSDYARITGDLYYPYSHSAHKEAKAIAFSQILLLVESRDLTVDRVAKELKIPKGTIDSYLKQLTLKGKLKQRAEGNTFLYSRISDSDKKVT